MFVSSTTHALAVGLLLFAATAALTADEPYLLPAEDDPDVAPASKLQEVPPIPQLPPRPRRLQAASLRDSQPAEQKIEEIPPLKPVSPTGPKSDERWLLKDVTPPELAEPVPTLAEQPEPKHGALYGSFEYLLFRPRISNQQYAIVDASNNVIPQGALSSVTDNLRSGFAFGVGYRFASSWDIGFNYTTFHSQGSDSASAPPGGLIYPEMTRPGLTDSVLNAFATARLNYNAYDLEMGKLLDVDATTQFRVFTGIRFASIQQNLSAYYNGNLADYAFASNTSNFSGAGPIVGGELRWKVCRGLSLFGKTQGGLIYGNTRSAVIETNNGGDTLYTDVTDKYRSTVPMIGFSIGGSYQWRGFTFSAGYQAVNYFSLIQRPAFVDTFSEGKVVPQNSDLSLDGFFFKLGYAY